MTRRVCRRARVRRRSGDTGLLLFSRGERIRTSDFLVPNQARYQTALRPGENCCLLAELQEPADHLSLPPGTCQYRKFQLQRKTFQTGNIRRETTGLSKGGVYQARRPPSPPAQGWQRELHSGFEELTGGINYTEAHVRYNPREQPNRARASHSGMAKIAELEHRPHRGADHDAADAPAPDERVQPDPPAVALRPARGAEGHADGAEPRPLSHPHHGRGCAEGRVPSVVDPCGASARSEPEVPAVEIRSARQLACPSRGRRERSRRGRRTRGLRCARRCRGRRIVDGAGDGSRDGIGTRDTRLFHGQRRHNRDREETTCGGRSHRILGSPPPHEPGSPLPTRI
jgi:hypothetical protein